MILFDCAMACADRKLMLYPSRSISASNCPLLTVDPVSTRILLINPPDGAMTLSILTLLAINQKPVAVG